MKDHLMSAGPFALNRVAVAAAFSVLTVLPVSSWALGLGKLNVQSALGEALRAEIDVTSLSPDEGGSLQVRVATPETYRAAGVDYNQVLGATSITLQRRADGRPYLRITSDRTVQEPFVDVILDLSWNAGRLVREYTLLFDPPSSRTAVQTTSPVIDAPTAPAPAVVAESEPRQAPVKAVTPSPEPAKSRKAAKPAAAASKPVEPEQAAAPAKVAPAETVASGADSLADTVRVKPGDSLSRIAGRTAQPGVSLDQMLVGLYRNNPQAFVGNNMNRLKSGVVLNVPTKDQAASVTQDEARKIIVAQSADFAAYRQQLAGTVTPTAPDQPQRQAKGKVEAEVQDRKQVATPAPDKLTLSKGGMAAGSAPGAEDRLAKARAKQEDKARVAELSKNLDELRKLKDKAAAASAPVKAAPAPVAPSKPAPAPVPAPAVVPSKPAVVVPPAPTPEASRPAVVVPASAPASEASIADAVASAASSQASGAATSVADEASAPEPVASSVRPSLPVPTPQPAAEAEEPGFLESLNPMLLAAGGAAVALLAGAAMYLRSRRRGDTGETSFLESRLQPDSFFGASGGQRVDTRDASGGPSSMSYSLSQLDAIGDVDPVAEADVYLAYGRDLQAEEILKEALRSTPDRLAVRTKLLEVYAKRRDTKGFEQLAVQLYHLTNGQGDDWAKAQEMGLGIDPENPLYQPGGQPSEAPLSVEAPGDLLGASTVPHSVMPTPSALDTMAPPAAAPAAPLQPDLVDLDLDISAPAPLDEVTDSVSPPTTEAGDLPPLELPEVETTVIEPKQAPDDGPMDLPSLDDDVTQPFVAPPAPAPAGDNSLDFDLSVDEAAAPPPAVAAAPASFDLNSINLDLDTPPTQAEPAPTPAPQDDWMASAPADEQAAPSDPMTRKFELAEEFRQIGDVDGARELLQEVLENTPDGPLKSKAQSMLDSLS